jgi:hypothetical protein
MSPSVERHLALILALLCAACKPAPQKPATPVAAGPTIRATVVTVRTTIQPGSRMVNHTIVIVGDRARSTAEHDTWRLFDTKEKTVTFVDDIARTIRTESLETLVKRRRDATDGDLPAHYPSARFVPGSETKTLLGVTAHLFVIESGAYRRELWLAQHPSIPRGLFAMMRVAEPPSSPLAPMMRKVDDALAEVDDFPLLDHAEVTYGEKKSIVDRAVVSVQQRDVPQTEIVIPTGYRDVSPKAR